MDRHLVTYYIGIALVFITHVYLLTKANTSQEMQIHSLINLFAGLCIAYYFMNKEGYIAF